MRAAATVVTLVAQMASALDRIYSISEGAIERDENPDYRACLLAIMAECERAPQ